jgi:hypothetical protein
MKKTKKLSKEIKLSNRLFLELKWHARRSGGLFFGVRIDFPVYIMYENGETRSTWSISFGLLVASVTLEILGKVQLL